MPIENVLKGVWRLPMTSTDAYGPYFEMSHHVGWNTVTSNYNDARDGWHAASDAFFDSLTAAVSQLSEVWNGVVQMRTYNLGLTTPVADSMDNLGPYTRVTGNVPPPELCMALTTWTEPYGSVTRRQSLQNRFYVGPWANVSGPLGRPSATARQRLIDAYDAYVNVFDGIGIDANFPVVASPTNGTSSAIEGYWVDNDWDVQRRRGYKPTAYTGTRPS